MRTPRKSERERKRLVVGDALRNARRPLVLAGNPLIEEPMIRRLAAERYAGAVMAEELALSDLLSDCAQRVSARIGDDPRLGAEALVLATVREGGSVRSAAQRLGKSREHISNTAWKTVTGWLLDESERASTRAADCAGS